VYDKRHWVVRVLLIYLNRWRLLCVLVARFECQLALKAATVEGIQHEGVPLIAVGALARAVFRLLDSVRARSVCHVGLTLSGKFQVRHCQELHEVVFRVAYMIYAFGLSWSTYLRINDEYKDRDCAVGYLGGLRELITSSLRSVAKE
jgi:hypothetical protein